ncbi:alpha-1-antiproteinase-like [Lacerta agilis]|uniref:alpha-1-antiproteinase-like n=1 Tax=Lacerta agilis TaxID=80427 RepID=UPI001419746D|nr:alpha-1-antiproteinase-like [Lacerta agilis]
MQSAICLCLILASLSNGHHLGPDEQNSTQLATRLYPNVGRFAIKFMSLASSASPDKNIFFSPLSIVSTFSIVSLGAKSATRTQILEGLCFNLTEIPEKEIHQALHNDFSTLTRSDSGYQLELGDALFLREGLEALPTFLDDVKAFYAVEVLPTKFQEPKEAEKQINDYIEKKTHGKISEIVKGLDPDTSLAVANYIFFKGAWEKPFDPAHTEERDFFVNEHTTVKVPMMHRLGWFRYYYDTELHCQVLQMDYKGSATTFFILPDSGKLKQVEEAFSLDTWTKWAVKVQRATASVFLPKFNISAKYELKEPLSKMGITDVFSDQADLTGITGQPLKVAKATHKAVLTVDEKGSEAAAATVVEAIPMSLPPTLEFNMPFYVLMYERQTNYTLFVGKIVNPVQH